LPLSGRKLWLAGIGGAGMSGYAILAKAWGADVSGWDRRETPYLEGVQEAGIAVKVSEGPPVAPADAEAFVSSAFAGRIEGASRAELLSELVGLTDSIVLDRLGRDPSFLIGGEIPQLGGNARAGGGWLIVEGDESDRSVFSLPATVAVITNVELDHHSTFGSDAELERAFDEWASGIETVIWGRDLEPVDFDLAVPGDHNRLNAACALAALEAIDVSREEARRVLAEFSGAHRRFELVAEAGGVRLYDDYGHHPSEIAATLATARSLVDGGRLLVLFQPHLYSRTLHRAGELAEALAGADIAAVTDIYPARRRPPGRGAARHAGRMGPGSSRRGRAHLGPRPARRSPPHDRRR
jgi:UDP-N-acetylmuramate--alanine ligase